MANVPTPTALIVAPHPDDESLGCGGTIKLITQSGGVVDVLYMTRGERGVKSGESPTVDERAALAQTRSREARQACDILGVRDVDFLPGTDGTLISQPQLFASILKRLRERAYASIYFPWPQDRHTDHIATFEIVRRALREYEQEIEVWLYEVWAPLQPNIAIAIDRTIDAKMEAIRAHQSQMAVIDYATAFHALAQYRSLSCPLSRYAEVFINCDRAGLQSLATNR